MAEDSKYRMNISLNVLNHLGLNLYSNTSAVLAEVIANAWDADASEVRVDFDSDQQKITISDNGTGMDRDAVNDKYLCVGYQRRQAEGTTTRGGRKPMGRKGIGKLSLFSIAEGFSVYSRMAGEDGEAFRLDAAEIKQATSSEDPSLSKPYRPATLPFYDKVADHGTIIEISSLKKNLTAASIKGLRKQVARRFGLVADQHQFKIVVNGVVVTLADRDYFHKAQFLYRYGDYDYSKHCVNLDKKDDGESESFRRSNELNDSCDQGETKVLDDEELSVSGWIAVAHKSNDLDDGQDNEDNLNKVTIVVRGKVAQEDILHEFRLGGIITKFFFGEIHADFLDSDNSAYGDCATSSRQRIKEDDPRYLALKAFLNKELRHLWVKTDKLKEAKGLAVAREIHPNIGLWFNDLNPDHKNAANRLFARINKLPLDDEGERRRLFISSILAFESLSFRNLLHRLDNISVENLPALRKVFLQLDDLEASAYYSTVKQRLEVIGKLAHFAEENALERAIQEHLYDHLWLLDPTWERIPHTARMETAIRKIFDSDSESMSNERLDIYYATTAGKHLIIELKRPDRVLRAAKLADQIDRYRSKAVSAIYSAGKDNPLEFICVIGKPLRDWNELGGRKKAAEILRAVDARVVTYEELIVNAQEQYKEYIARSQAVGRIYELIQSVEKDDLAKMRPEVANSQ